MSLQRVNHEYIQCGKEFGPYAAEKILTAFLPEEKRRDGVCSDVSKEKYPSLIESFRVGRVVENNKEGVK